MEFLRKVWEGWKRFGQFIGDVVGRLVLTLFYFTIFVPFGLGVRLFADPLHRKQDRSGKFWLERRTKDRTVDDGLKQF